jgi:hypothetical protein
MCPAKRGYILPDNLNPPRNKCAVFCLPDDEYYLRAFWGQIEQLSYWYTWERDEARRGRDAAAYWRDIFTESYEAFQMTEGNCQFCCDEELGLLRDILNALPKLINGASANITAYLQTLVEKYLSNPQAIGDNVPDITYVQKTGDSPGDVEKRRGVLCRAISDYITRIRDEAWIRWQIGQGLITTGLELISSALEGPLGMVIVTFAAEIVFEYAEDLWTDDDALREVICCMYANLAAADVSKESFAGSLEFCGFPELSHEAQLAYIIHMSNQQKENWLLFLQHLDLVANRVFAGEISAYTSCPCLAECANCAIEDTYTINYPASRSNHWYSLDGVELPSIEGQYANCPGPRRYDAEAMINGFKVRAPEGCIKRADFWIYTSNSTTRTIDIRVGTSGPVVHEYIEGGQVWFNWAYAEFDPPVRSDDGWIYVYNTDEYERAIGPVCDSNIHICP